MEVVLSFLDEDVLRVLCKTIAANEPFEDEFLFF